MSHTEIERLVKNVTIHVPGALEAVLKLELFNVLDEFFRDSLIWKEEVDFETEVDETFYYAVNSDPGTIISLVGVANENDAPVAATMQVPGEITLGTAPSVVETLTATVVLTTVDPVDGDGWPQMPEWILSKYRQGIAAGLLGRLMSQPAKPYTNERLSIYHYRRFRGAVALARAEAEHKNLHDGQAWRFPAFA
jgi:hypothetical protein